MERTFEGSCGIVVCSELDCSFVETDSDTAMTIIAVLSEDPSTWKEIVALWPRYCTPPVLQSISELQLTNVNPTKLVTLLADYEDWVVIDLQWKRLCTSDSMGLNGSNCVFDIFERVQSDQRWPLSIHLPPWWEYQSDDTLELIRSPRQKPLIGRSVNRDVLFGEPLFCFLASQIAEEASKPFFINAIKTGSNKLYSKSVELHRQWLMTPRQDLGGDCPRKQLHGGHDWISRVIQGQQLRATAGLPLVALPCDFANSITALMGMEEVVIYFDLCRRLLESGWEYAKQWIKKQSDLSQDCREMIPELIEQLNKTNHRWLKEPFEDGPSAQFILECSRRRVPRSCDYPIEGMHETQPAHPIIDCNCPFCQMMASGALGSCFDFLDGHHLELDEEFAFSLIESLEQWEEEQGLLGTDLGEEAEEATSN